MKVRIDRNVIPATCPHCGSELDVAFNDVERCSSHSHDVDQSGLGAYCGACGQHFVIPPNDVPAAWRQTLFADDD